MESLRYRLKGREPSEDLGLSYRSTLFSFIPSPIQNRCVECVVEYKIPRNSQFVSRNFGPYIPGNPLTLPRNAAMVSGNVGLYSYVRFGSWERYCRSWE